MIALDIKSKIRTVKDYPKQGILFYDITTLLLDPEATRYCVNKIVEHFKGKKIDVVIGAESRGFIFGTLVAEKLGVGFALVRKCGKLPAETERVEYETEYSKDCVEIHKDAVNKGDKVLIVDDLAATGGTAAAQIELVKKVEGEVVGLAFVVELTDLGLREKLKGYEVFSVVKAEGG